jgi:threonine dehydrogenase-like Zn-dependent dehydrogenase
MPNHQSYEQLHQIQAAVLRRQGGPLEIESLELEGPWDDEVLVGLVASGICRTDIDFCGEWYEGGEALVLGHEGAGVVEEVGRGVQGFAPVGLAPSAVQGLENRVRLVAVCLDPSLFRHAFKPHARENDVGH